MEVPRKARRRSFWQQKLKAKEKTKSPKSTGDIVAKKSTPPKTTVDRKKSKRTRQTQAQKSSTSKPLSSRGFRMSCDAQDNASKPNPVLSCTSSLQVTVFPDSEDSLDIDGKCKNEGTSRMEGLVGDFSFDELSVSSHTTTTPSSVPGKGSSEAQLGVPRKKRKQEGRLHLTTATGTTVEPSAVLDERLSSSQSHFHAESITSKSETRSGVSCGEKRRRYILFVGNLPYMATADSVVDHFKRRGVPVGEVRMLTAPGSARSRGCCFVEFDNTKAYLNALRVHHTVMEGRQLNVEMTCGGGGRGEGRRSKIVEKNRRLLKAKTAKKRRLVEALSV